MTCKHLKTYFKPHEPMTKALFDKEIKKMAVIFAGHDSARETLENQANLRENRALIADQDWIDGRQAAWIR